MHSTDGGKVHKGRSCHKSGKAMLWNLQLLSIGEETPLMVFPQQKAAAEMGRLQPTRSGPKEGQKPLFSLNRPVTPTTAEVRRQCQGERTSLSCCRSSRLSCLQHSVSTLSSICCCAFPFAPSAWANCRRRSKARLRWRD